MQLGEKSLGLLLQRMWLCGSVTSKVLGIEEKRIYSRLNMLRVINCPSFQELRSFPGYKHFGDKTRAVSGKLGWLVTPVLRELCPESQ